MDLNNGLNNKISNALYSLENFITVSVMRPLMAEYANKTTILAYHNIPSTSKTSDIQEDSVAENEFELQMRFLRDNPFEVVSLQQLVSNLSKGKSLNKKTVIVTFDDGYRTTFSNAFPIMKKYNIPATIFLAVEFIGKNKSFPWLTMSPGSLGREELSPMDWEEVAELHKAGIEIGSHTLTHQFLPKLNETDIEREILHSQSVIESKIGEKPCAFAFPFSFPIVHRGWPSFKSKVVNALKKGNYTCGCTVLRGHISKRTNPFFLKRMVIGKFDDLESFHAKLVGGYAWTRVTQLLFQTLAKQYSE